MLLGNYNSEYLDSISTKIENLSLRYRELYTECYNVIEGYANTSVQSHLLKGLAGISKSSGELASKVPIVSKSEIDGKLKETGNRLEKLEFSKNNRALEEFISAKNSRVQLFVDNINRLNKLYNEQFEFLINKEYIYIKNT